MINHAIQILVIDNDAKFRQVLSQLLKDQGFEPAALTPGEQVLAWIKDSQPAVVLLNAEFGAISSLDIIQQIKLISPRTECIILAEKDSPISARDAVHSGAYHCIRKPCDDELLLITIQRAVEKHQAENAALRSAERLYQLNQELALLNRLIVFAASITEPERILEITCQELALAFNVPQVAAALLEENGRTLKVVAEYHETGRPSGLDRHIPLEENPATQYVLQHKAPLFISDPQNDPRMAAVRGLMKLRGVQAILLLPLIVRGQVLGTIGIDSTHPRHFSNDEITLAMNAISMAGQAMENARMHEQTNLRLQQLTALHYIDLAINANLDLKVTFGILLEQVTKQLNMDAATILLYNPMRQTLEMAANYGFYTPLAPRITRRLGKCCAGKAIVERRIIRIVDLSLPNQEIDCQAQLSTTELFRGYCAAPLITKGKVHGVMEILRRDQLKITPEWTEFLETLTSQAAIAIDNANLFENLQRSNVEMTMAYDTTLQGWARALELRRTEPPGHMQRVLIWVEKLARALGVNDTELMHIRRGTLLHDIGTMGIPDSILNKPGPLDEAEWEIMRMHPTYAYELLSPTHFLRQALNIPYCHHERWDGSGYPRGLKAEMIPLAARIFAVIDTWDSMCSERPYRPALPEEEVLAHLRAEAGKQFDPHIVEVFLALVKESFLKPDG